MLAGSIVSLLGPQSVRAASQTWDGGSPIDGLWSTVANWLGDPTPPGRTSVTTSTDVATFNAAIANTWGVSVGNPIGIDLNRNIAGINFDLAAGNYFVGSTGGNALLLTGGGTIQILKTLTATNAVMTVSAPLQLRFTGYTLRNDSANGSGAGAGTLKIGGGITGTTSATILTLTGSNTNANTISGVIGNGGATSVALTKNGIGNWTLTAANTYTGETVVNGGTLTLAFGTVSTNILASTSALTMGGGTLALTGSGAQTVAGLTTTTNTASRIVLGANETLTLGGLAAGVSSMLNFNTAAGGANGATLGTGVIVLTGRTAGSVIDSGFTVSDAGGFGLATVNASNQIIRRTTTTLVPASGSGSTTDYQINNNAGGVAAAGSSTLIVTASEAVKSITVDTTARSGVLTLNSGVVLSNNIWNFGGVGSNTYQITNAAGAAAGTGLKSVASSNDIVFNNYAAGAVTIAAPILANGTNFVLVFGTGTTLFQGANTYTGGTTVSGGTLQVPVGGSITHTSRALTVGNASGDNGTLVISGGAVSNASGTVGSLAGSSGSATVSSGTWTNSDSLTVGDLGSGVLTISGGTVSNNTVATFGNSAGSSGSATVSSGTWTNSGILNVGSSGSGVLTISGGAVSNTSATLAVFRGSSGSVTVSSGTWTNSGSLAVGGGGTGVLTISGGAVSSAGGTLGINGGSSGSVTVSSGTWTNSGTLTVGDGGSGVLTISGGAVSNSNATVGTNTGSSGSATVSGGTWTNSGNLTVGNSGTGILNLTGSGMVQVGSTGTGTLTLASGAGSRGTLNLGTGGEAGTLTAAIVTSGTGTSKVVNFNHTGSTTFAPQLTGALTVNKLGAGTTTLTQASNTYTGATTVSGGTLLVSGAISGSAIGVAGTGSTLGGTGTVKDVSVGGGAVLQGGDGTAASGALTATGTVSLADNSVIKLTLGPGFTHSSLTRSGANAWTFDSNQLVTFTIGDGASVGFYDNVISGLSGLDLNASNLATVSTWQIDPLTGVTGTFSYDGAGGVDLTVAVIPEPGSALLLAVAGAGLLARRRRR